MFIAIIGTQASGKSTVKDYLVSHKGFTCIKLAGTDDMTLRTHLSNGNFGPQLTPGQSSKHASFLTMSDNTPMPSPVLPKTPISIVDPTVTLKDAEELLDYTTHRWRTNFVTLDLHTREDIEKLIKRPFFLLLHVDGPLIQRYRQCQSFSSLEQFVTNDDRLVFGVGTSSSLKDLDEYVGMRITNDFPTLPKFRAHLDEINLTDPGHLRPNWDTYFMTLASLASQRSNCMKRRVGAILVRDHRIVSTGYNGTPRHLVNCADGGCVHCNGTSEFSDVGVCLCLHAEENALLEAGRERVGAGCVLYCNTCPCLKCTIKIIQTGVASVVYNLAYKMDVASAKLFKDAGIELRQFDPKRASPSHRQLEPIPQNDQIDNVLAGMQLRGMS